MRGGCGCFGFGNDLVWLSFVVAVLLLRLCSGYSCPSWRLK